jgi:O-antigen/teichoic acid export membrane protein
VALYGVAYQIAAFLFALPMLLANALLPDFMRSDVERRRFLGRRAMDVMLTVALPLPIFGAIFARPFVVWVGGSAFSAAGPLLAILTVAGAIALVNGFLYQMAIFAGAERGLWRATLVTTVCNLAGNALAVTLWGAMGAASVMVFTEALGLVIYGRIYRTRMPIPLGRRYPLSAVGASAGMLAIWAGLHEGLRLAPGVGFAMLPRALALLAAYALLLATITLLVRLVVHGRPTATGQ